MFVFSSADDKAMTAEQVKECYFNNVEIACHGSNHINTKADLLRNVEELEDMGIDVKNIGFASPHSTLTLNNRNENGIWSLVEEGVIKYVRSGIQIRREGII